MDILIDGKIIENTYTEIKTLGEVLGYIEAECEKNKKTITTILVNNESVLAENLDSFFSKEIKDFNKIELFTTSAPQILEMLYAIGNNLLLIAENFKEIPIQLQTKKDEEALKTIGAFSEQMGGIQKIIPLFSSLHAENKEIIQELQSISVFISEMTPLLETFLKGLYDKDSITVGDIAEYELAPMIEQLAHNLLLFCK